MISASLKLENALNCQAGPARVKHPKTRESKTRKFDIQGHEGDVYVGLDPDGRPGELFITPMGIRKRSTIGGLMDVIGIQTSFLLQYGVPLESIVNKLAHTRFEPSGFTRDPDVPMAKSIVDYVFRWLGIQFVPGYRESNAPQRVLAVSGGAPAVEETAAPAKPALGTASLGFHFSEPGIVPRERPAGARTIRQIDVRQAGVGTVDRRAEQFARLQADAPACDTCGAIMVRTGTCYTCHECGSTSGCG